MIATSSVSIVNVNDGATGATGPQGVSVTKVVEEYRLSNSSTELTGSGTGYTWSETKPDIPSGKYLWIRERTDLSNNTSSYGTAHCDIVISGLVQDVDRNSNAITSKVWESDITTKINEYDGSTGAAIRDRVTQTETSITGITSRVSDVESETDSLGTRMTSAESSITQNANNIALKVSQDGVISSINQSPETIKISASKVNIEGAVTFSSFDSTLQNRLTTAESDASTAKSNASSAVSTANTASSNASSALTKVNNSIKSTTMHYLATSASSGVTTSTSGWTTTIQSITKDKPYLWTYQTVTKINDTTSNTDPVISGVYGATGGKGDTGTGVTKVEQLYRTSNSTTAPAAPTSAVSSTSTSYNTWTLAMPTYNTSYPYYYICTQTTYDNGTVKWTTVSRSKALEDANSTANTANTNASNAVSTANTANTNASNAVSTANTANTNASNAVTTANQAKSKADSAASLLSTWTGDATLATTTINGGYIKTHTIESTHLATNAIMSQNYTGLDNSHFSSEGSYLDLSTGNFYTPKFGVSAEGQGGAYINGEVVATSGRFGNDTSYWNIATVYDYNSQPHASLVGTGSPYLQTGNWQVSDNAVATRKYTSTSESAGNATYYKDSDTNTFYDVGMKIPTDFSSTAATNDVGRYNKAFYYGRKYTGNNPPTVEGNWVYFYMLDTSGNLKTAGTITTGGDIYEGGTKLSEKYAAISDVGSVYLPKTGGTITGNLTVNGSFTTNLQVQTNLASTSAAQLTGNANATVTHGVTGTLGVGNGGTGKSSWTANQIVYASASNTLSQLGSGTSGQILKSNGSSAPSWVNQSTLSVGSATKATQDGNGNVIVNTYMPIAGGQFTGAVYVPDEFSADSAQLGSLIVNGAARFTNDVFADTFTGNLVGTASNAVKVGNNLVIKLNGGSTEGTNLFTYNGSAAKTINITASSIGAQASGTYAGGISNGGAASKLAYQADNEINFVSTASTPPYQVHFNWRNGYTNTQTGTSSDIGYLFENYNGEYNHTTLYAAYFSGNAATATSFASAKSVTLTGDTTGTASSTGGWSISTKTNQLSTIGTVSGDDHAKALKAYFDAHKSDIPRDKLINFYSSAHNNGSQAFGYFLSGYNDTPYGGFFVAHYNSAYYVGISGGAYNEQKLLTDTNYSDYTVKKDGTGATGTWGINVTGTASKLATARTISLTGSVTGSVSFDGSGDVSIATTTNHTHNYAGSNSAGGALSTGVAWAAGTDNAARRVWFSNTNSTNTVAYPVYDDDFKYNPSTNVLTVGSISGSAAYLTTGRTLTIGNTGKTFNGSSDVSWTKADISANATTSANGWMSSDDKTKLNGIQAGAQVNTITGVKGGSETDYRTGNVNITASNIGLGNVTNNKQVKGLASGTTSGHLVSWGSDGYTIADSGITTSGVNKTVTSLASNDEGKIVLTYLDGTTSTPIEVKIIGQSGSSVSYADALNVNGTAVGGSEQPVYINNQGKPATANKIPKLNNTTTGGAFYAPTGAGSANQVLVSSGSGAPTWTTLTKSAIGLGNVVNLDQSKAIKSITKSGGTYTATALDDSSFTFSESITGVKGSAETSYRTGNVNITPANIGAISKTDELLTTNPFAPTVLKGPYISKIDDALYVAHKRWNVTATNISGSVSTLFDGSYESSIQIGNDKTAVITMDFSTEPNGYFPGYPYGYFLISFYYICAPKSVSGRVYCNYSSHGVGWHDITFTRVGDATEAGAITYRGYNSYYAISKVEISIVGDGSNSYGYTAVSEIELHLDRPSSDRNPFLSKYSPETLYYDLTAPNFIGNLSGNATTATKFASNQSVTLTGDVTGTASSQAGWSISTTLSNSGVTADSYGPSANASPSHGGTFSVPYITVDAKGRITSASTKTITLPSSGNTDTKVTQTAVTASSYTYWRPLIFGYSNSATEGFSPSTVTDQVYTTSTLSVQPSSGTIRATTFKGNLSGNATTATTATYSNYPNIVSTNEIRFNNKPSDATDIHIGYKWADGTSDAKINSYKFENGNAALTNVYANTFYGALSGNASTATKWASAQTVYVALGTASKTTSIQGGSSSAVTLGVDGVLGVANGGTGASSFTANSVIMSGSSTTGAFTTRAVTNNTSASAVTANTNLITANTLAYWTGSSNLTTCSQGTFGTMASASASDYLKLSGGTMTGTIITTPNTLSMNFRNYNSYNTGFFYGTTGNEALTVALQNSVTSFMIKHGTDPLSYNSGTWNTGVPTLQAKKNSVYINELIPSGTDPTYKFKVNGTSALKGGTDLFDSTSDNTHANVSYDSTLQAIVFSFA